MENEELETTNSIDEEVETEKEVETEASEPVELSTEEPEKVKTFTQKELDDIVEARVKRERVKLDKEYNSKLSKYEEMAYLTKEGLKANSYDEALDKARDFYGKQGIKYEPVQSARETEILAKADAEEILDSCDSTRDIETEVQRILSKGINISERERLVAQKLTDELTSRSRVSELEKMGVKKEVYESKEFKNFESKFNKETPITDIYELYNSKHETKKFDNPGSMKSTPAKEKKAYISEAEFDKMTDEEIEKNMELIHASMSKW